jgi:carbonic anhydrase
VRGQEVIPSPAVALERLKDGNKRFAAERPIERNVSALRRAELARGQHPFAVILTCADSRVAPEIIFDQGLGDLFVLRVAGNIADPGEVGSIEYAVEHLHVPLVVVLGHEKCGAVQAAVEGKPIPGDLGWLVRQIYVGDDGPGRSSDPLAAGIQANALYQASELTHRSHDLADLVKAGRVRVVCGVYSLTSGTIHWLDRSDEKPAHNRQR